MWENNTTARRRETELLVVIYIYIIDITKIIIISWRYIFIAKSGSNCWEMVIKGQMNQKIDIFSLVALPSPNTKKNHPKWDLGKDFSSQAFIER